MYILKRKKEGLGGCQRVTDDEANRWLSWAAKVRKMDRIYLT